MDGFSSWVVVFVGLLTVVAALYSAGWWRERGGAPGRHAALVLLAGAGAATALLADDLLTLIVGWETVTLALFLLAVSGRDDAGAAAAKTYTLLEVGDLALILGAVLLGLERAAAGVPSPWSLSALARDPLATTDARSTAVYLLFLLAAMAKAGAMPMHSWIPTLSTTTHASVMAFLPGSLDKVLGIYLLTRASVDWMVPSPSVRFVVMAIGAVTILGGVLMALVQHDLRRLLSFHAVSQVGYMLLGLGTGTLVGAMGGVFHMVNHALYKSCLFLGAGTVERETGTLELDRLGGLGRTMPVTFGCMLVAALSISGVPPLNGFASKWLVYQGCVAAGEPVLLVAALFGSVLTLASFVKVLHSVFWGARPARLEAARERGGVGIPTAMLVLALLCVGLGIAAAWPLERFVGPAVGLERGGASALAGSRATWGPLHGVAAAPALDLPAAVYSPVGVTGLLVLGSLLALGVGYLGALRSRRVRPAFVGGDEVRPRDPPLPGHRVLPRGAGDARARTRDRRRRGRPARRLPGVPAGRRAGRGPAAAPPHRAAAGLRGVVPAGRGRGARLPALELTLDAILVGLAAFLVLGSVAALEMKNLLSAVITVGVVGMGLSILFLLLGAPDIAITQVVVEVIVVTVMIRATKRTADEEAGRPRSLATVVAGIGAVLVLVGFGVAAFAALPPSGRRAEAVGLVPLGSAACDRGRQRRDVDHPGLPRLRHPGRGDGDPGGRRGRARRGAPRRGRRRGGAACVATGTGSP